MIGIDDPDKVLAWIEERITCHIPDKDSDPELHNLVTTYQMHKCTDYCKKTFKKGKVWVKRCKFGYPLPACESAKLHPVAERLKKRQKVYEITRKESETRVNVYNPLLLMLWKANMDVQFVSESSLALSQYVTDYITKAEKSHMHHTWQEVSESGSIYSRLWKFGLRMMRCRECGLYEATDILLGDHLSGKSTDVRFVKVDMPHKRKRRLKDHRELERMKIEEPDSKDLFLEDLHTSYYPGRPEELEDMCLHEFVSNFNYYGSDASGNRKYTPLTKPRFVNHRIFDPNKENERAAFFYSLLLLFVPFRDESCLLNKDETPEEAYYRLLHNNEECSAYCGRMKNMLKAKENVAKINEARAAEREEPVNKEDEEDPQLPGVAKSAMKDLQEMKDVANGNNALTLEERVRMLNDDQRRVFDRVKNHLMHQQEHERGECKCEKSKPLRMFVSGVGGTGKSFLIEAIRSMADGLWETDDLKCAVTAPTGLASFNVGGVTIYRIFWLPIEHEGKEAGYWALPKGVHKVLKSELRSMKLLIIDEVSMVSSLNLAYIHLRLEELFGGEDWFGDVNILFMGDLLQLQPVNGKPAFETVDKKSIKYKLGCGTAVNIWKECVEYDELTINERQKKDGGYSSLLNSVRQGLVDEEITTTLKERVIDDSVPNIFKQLQEEGMSPVCLFPTRKQCDAVNVEMLQLLDSKVHELGCTDEVDETKSTNKWHKKAAEKLDKLNKDCSNTAGLEALLKIAVGARVMLRRNNDVKAGLVNGAIGTVLEIHPSRISIKFDHLSEPCDIKRVSGKFMVMKNCYVQRTQFPLILAYAVTIHKCQGLSLDCAIIDLSDKVFADGMAYVALSRVRSLNGLHLTAFDPKSIKVNVKALREINRLRRLYRPDLAQYAIPAASSKRKLTGKCESEPTLTKPGSKTLGKQGGKKQAPKKTNYETPDVLIVGETPGNAKFHSVNAQWQRNACTLLGVTYEKSNGVRAGNFNMPLTPPDMGKLKKILPDGNCMFRSLSYIVTGSEDHYQTVRAKIVEHSKEAPSRLLGHIKGKDEYKTCKTVSDYIKKSGMNKDCVWGSDIELLSFAHLTKTCVYSYTAENGKWNMYGPHNVDRRMRVQNGEQALYLLHRGGHYDVVLQTGQSGVAASAKAGEKRQSGNVGEPPSKRLKADITSMGGSPCEDGKLLSKQPCRKCKSQQSGIGDDRPPKKRRTHAKKPANPPDKKGKSGAGPTRGPNHEWVNYRFYSVDEQWQRDKCNFLGLPFHSPNGVSRGAPDLVLTQIDSTQRIRGDGNCLFRCFSYLITGSENYHFEIRSRLIEHMPNIPNVFTDTSVHSVDQYLRQSRMDRNRTWGDGSVPFIEYHYLYIYHHFQ